MDTKGTDFQSMMATFMQNAQKNLRHVYQGISQKDNVIGKAGGDLVKAHVNLKMSVTQLELQPALFEEKHEVIAELIASAVNQGLYLAQQAIKQEMQEVSQKIGLGENNFGV